MSKIVKGVYLLKIEGGRQSLLEADSLKEATGTARDLHGCYYDMNVRPATQEDIAWTRAMGGWIPERLR